MGPWDGIPGACSSPVQFIPGNFVAHVAREFARRVGGRGFWEKVAVRFEGKDQRRGRRGRGTLKVGLWDF